MPVHSTEALTRTRACGGRPWGVSQLPSTKRHLLSRAGKLLPAVQFLQKGIQRHLDDISKLYVYQRHRWAGWARV